MGMLPTVSQRAYTTQNQKLFVASGEEREASFAAAELRKDVPEDQVLDITVTCDGILARRGFQSLYGVVMVVSWKSGKMLDVEVLSKHCQACATHHGIDSSPDEFMDWWEDHGFMRDKLQWFILRDEVNWSPCNLDTVCEQE